MKITYLGQAGFLMETDGLTVLIDPYLSDSVEKIQPQNYRRVPVNEHFLTIYPNVIVLTHNHLDHTDPETLRHYLNENSQVVVLASKNAWNEIRKFGGTSNNYVMFNEGTSWTQNNVLFRAVKAEHSDEYAIGVVIKAEGKNYYFTGDTLYNESVFKSLPNEEIEALFLPINGKGNNMNKRDASLFAERIDAKKTVPVHIGMFDETTAEDFTAKRVVIPSVYQEISLE